MTNRHNGGGGKRHESKQVEAKQGYMDLTALSTPPPPPPALLAPLPPPPARHALPTHEYGHVSHDQADGPEDAGCSEGRAPVPAKVGCRLAYSAGQHSTAGGGGGRGGQRGGKWGIATRGGGGGRGGQEGQSGASGDIANKGAGGGARGRARVGLPALCAHLKCG